MFFTTTINGLVQALGIVSVMPLIALLTEPSLADTHPYFLTLKSYIPQHLHDSLLIIIGTGAFSILLLGNLFVIFDYWLTLKFFNVKEFKLSVRLLNQYMTGPYLAFKKRRISDMTRNVVSEVDRVIVGSLLSLVGLISDLIIAITIIMLLLYVNVWVTLFASAVIAVTYILVYWFIVKKIETLGEEFTLLESKLYAAIRQSLEFFREIKVTRKNQYFLRRFSQPAKAITRNATRYNILRLFPEQIIEVFAFGLVILIAIYFSTHANTSAMVMSSITFFAFAVYRLIPIIKEIFDGIEDLRYLGISLEHILSEFADTNDEKNSVRLRLAQNPRREKIVFNEIIELTELSFKYESSIKDIFKNLTISIPAKQMTCITGPSGVGKSTLIDLLLGLIKADSGRICIDGVELTQSNLDSWLVQIGYVPQNIRLIEGSILENIAFGIPLAEIDIEQVKQVAKIVEIDSFITQELVEGYYTKIGDSKLTLSGGQKQRIGIARSLYHAPKILLLDEATNELDIETESQILNNLTRLSELTILFVTHKPSVIDRATHIIELQPNKNREGETNDG
ncbi:ABC transporter ATP-binding protein [Aliikangiella sp. GXAS 311]|uniref:ABC transporter ATP-binding protein n=2 Tax=Aliikangiella maris TaxID=3162458 RepID=A0ABV3MNH3_9GAMM